jgi:hypothetical protein
MKIVDIADEIHRELGSPSTLSIPAIAFWVRTNVGSMNNHLNTSYEIDSSSFEIVDSVDELISIYEIAILKSMYHIHYYDGLLRTVLATASTDSVIMLSSDGSTIKKINKNEQAKTYLTLRNQLTDELKTMVAAYKNRDVQPLQIAGDDDQSATYRPSREYIRISKNY